MRDNIEYLNINLQPADQELIKKFKTFKQLLTESQKKGEVLLLYRGDKVENIAQKLTGSYSHILPADRIFEFGDKARHYYMNSRFDGGLLKNINDVSDGTLGFIFDRLKNIINSPRHKDRVKRCLSQSFIEYFKANKKKEFINAIANSATKLQIRDYYLYLLHTAGRDGIVEETLLVSTTISKMVAQRFTIAGMRNQPSNGIIFHYFIPAPFQNYAIAPWLIQGQTEILKNLNLPTYNPIGDGLYPNQKEVGIKGALFPCFILGLELPAQKQFVLNPDIFHLEDDIMSFYLSYGIPVNQESFEENIFNTGFKGWVKTDGSGNFTQHDVVR